VSRRIRGATVALLLLATAGAWRPPYDQIKLGTESKLWFDGKSTVRDWSCKATQIDATIDAEAGAAANVLKAQKAVRSVTLTFPVAKLDCANGTMNGHMRKALNATAHEAITFTLTGYELSPGSPVTGTLTGTLILNGVSRPVSFPVEYATAANGSLRVTGKYALTMTEWQVQPPKLMMGALKVDPTIVVNFDLQLQP
jgi:hypothetical protein